MPIQNRNVRRRKRKKDFQTALLYILGIFVLGAIFFSLSFYVAQRLKAGVTSVFQPTSQIPRYTPKSQPIDEDVESNDRTPKVNIKITEHGQEQPSPTDDSESATDESGVKQDEGGITLTLEPETPKKPAVQVDKTQAEPKQAKTTSNTVKEKIDGKKPDTKLSRAATEVKKKPKPPAPDGSTYRVQAGVFSDRENADRMIGSLRDRGYKPDVVRVKDGDRTLLRIQIGRYKTHEDAQELVNDLKSEGFAPGIVLEKNAQ